MTSVRCSSCHCFSRNCPVGQPDHRTVSTVGQSCTMNSLGRHYRDPSNPINPTCNYELNGVKCTFFTDGNEFSSLPYPEDISLGPVSISLGPVSESNSELSSILALLQQQRAEQQQQAQNMKTLQDQVSSLLRQNSSSVSATPASGPTSSVVTTTTVTSTLPISSLIQAPTMTSQ